MDNSHCQCVFKNLFEFIFFRENSGNAIFPIQTATAFTILTLPLMYIYVNFILYEPILHETDYYINTYIRVLNRASLHI